MSCEFKSTQDNLQKLKADLEMFAKKEVYVGIPESDNAREGGEITNAQLAFIHTNGIRAKSMILDMQPALKDGKPYSKAYEMYIQAQGSPLWHSPPRPIIEPAIEANKDEIADMLKEAMQFALDGEVKKAQAMLDETGQFATLVSKGWFEDSRNGWAELSDYTKIQRMKKMRGKIFRHIERHYAETGSLQGVTGLDGLFKPLIDTGALRKSITHVIRER